MHLHTWILLSKLNTNGRPSDRQTLLIL